MKTYTEDQLVKSFVNKIHPHNFLGEPGIFLEQVETSHGIPDLIVLSRRQVKDLDSFVSRFPEINLTNGHAKIISNLRKSKYISKSSLIKKSGLRKEYLEKVIKILKSIGVVDENAEGYKLNLKFSLPKLDVWSFEFKLNNWRKALRQSLRHRTFSSHVSIVMPYSRLDSLSKNVNYFRRFKVGAAVFDMQTGQFQFVVKPAKCGAISKHSYIDTLGRLSMVSLLTNDTSSHLRILKAGLRKISLRLSFDKLRINAKRKLHFNNFSVSLKFGKIFSNTVSQ